MIPLALIRHAPSAWNEVGRIQGREDPPLAEAGAAQARAYRIPAELAGFAAYASPQRRALETARLMGLDPVVDPRLVEMDWGAWSGKTLAELRRSGGADFAADESRGLDFTPPGGESPRMVRARLAAWLAEVAGRGKPALAVTHKGVIRAALSLATGWDMLGKPPARLEWTCAHLFALDGDGKPRIDRLNLPLRGRGGRGRILFYVQHLLGIGHIRRSALIAGAFAAAGFDIDLVSGGPPVHDLDLGAANLVQLPPIRALDDSFKVLIDREGRVIDDAFKDSRRDRLLDLFHAKRPDVLIVELFPFGRRTMRFELVPLLEAAAAARPRPLILSSVRDILTAQADHGREAEMAAMAERWIDHVLVHGDPNVIAFDATFAEAKRLADRLVYTGYVAAPPSPGVDTGEVLVSVGGGAVGSNLLRVASLAPRFTRLNAPWRLLVGAYTDAGEYDHLRRHASPSVIIEPARPDFRRLLSGCLVSVSRGGYNTVMDVVAAGARAIVIPFEGRDETEQRTRAERFAAAGWLHLLRESDLTPETLAAAVDKASAEPRPEHRANLDGIRGTVDFVSGLLSPAGRS